MEPFVRDTDFTLYVGEARDVLCGLPDESVQTVVTSPPYWGLRDYGTGEWVGGDPDCSHSQGKGGQGPQTKNPQADYPAFAAHRGGNPNECPRCGARRVDQQLGLEATPELYVERLVAIFREVRRVLRKDGTCWLNLGDSYNSAKGNPGPSSFDPKQSARRGFVQPNAWGIEGMKHKDLVGIPWMVAFALRADGWYLRSEIIWAKQNVMPESVTDRPTKAHEQIFLLTKSARYFFDQEAVREPHSSTRWGGPTITQPPTTKYAEATGDGFAGAAEALSRPGREWNAYPEGGRNVRSVWEINTEPYSGAHFAVFPQALVERCVKAGTSEKGCCPACGAPWEQEIARGNSEHHCRPGCGCRDSGNEQDWSDGWRDYGGYTNTAVATGQWRPACACDPSDPIPCTVLDPFAGSGTTALVSRRLGRRSIGIELSAKYAKLAADRLQQLSLLA